MGVIAKVRGPDFCSRLPVAFAQLSRKALGRQNSSPIIRLSPRSAARNPSRDFPAFCILVKTAAEIPVHTTDNERNVKHENQGNGGEQAPERILPQGTAGA